MNWNSKKEVLEEVKQNGEALKYASDEFQNEIKYIGIENGIADQE